MNPFVQALVENHKAFGMLYYAYPTIPMSRAKDAYWTLENEQELFRPAFVKKV